MRIVLVTIVVILSALMLWSFTSRQQPESSVSEFPEPITGAFGIPLGRKFTPDMVASVLGKEQITYTDKAGSKLQRTLINIKPNKPSKNFQKYVIKTNQDGDIYAVEGKYHDNELTEKACKATVKSLAEELESRYGQPRGKDSFGQWYSFRQTSDFSKSLKLYAHRCRSGMYSIVYTDDKAKKEE